MGYVHGSEYECLVFDLDDTLYPLNSGIADACLKNIRYYMTEKLGIDKDKVPELSNLLYKNYGTSMSGLLAIGYNFDYDDYHSFVHGRLPYDKLKPDHVLRNILLSIPIQKVIFTNGDKIHAAKVLKKMELEDCFDGIICFETLNPPPYSHEPVTPPVIFDILEHFSNPEVGVDLPKPKILCKPNIDAMAYALKLANINPQKAIFFDDSVRNIQSGKRIGLHTVLVGTSHRVKGADHALESIHNIREALPELWEESGKSEDVRYSGKVTLETSVTA